jgi:hypothetical protein
MTQVLSYVPTGMQRCPYIAEMKERFWRSNGNEKKSTEDEGTDDLLKSAAMTKTKQKQSTIARLAQPEPDDPDETVPMLPPPAAVSSTSAPIAAASAAATSAGMAGPPPPVPTVVKVNSRKLSKVHIIRIWTSNVINATHSSTTNHLKLPYRVIL